MWEQGFVLAILLGIITCLLVTKIKLVTSLRVPLLLHSWLG
ncbi:sulfate permease, Trk-type [Vibrio sp. JCM 19053]|nr:sulfate permease, Trk-type [Vibrio sp. JCM 19053]